jgi:hypothetical protein
MIKIKREFTVQQLFHQKDHHLSNQLKLPCSNKINFQLDKIQLRIQKKGESSINAILTYKKIQRVFYESQNHGLQLDELLLSGDQQQISSF